MYKKAKDNRKSENFNYFFLTPPSHSINNKSNDNNSNYNNNNDLNWRNLKEKENLRSHLMSLNFMQLIIEYMYPACLRNY